MNYENAQSQSQSAIRNLLRTAARLGELNVFASSSASTLARRHATPRCSCDRRSARARGVLARVNASQPTPRHAHAAYATRTRRTCDVTYHARDVHYDIVRTRVCAHINPNRTRGERRLAWSRARDVFRLTKRVL